MGSHRTPALAAGLALAMTAGAALAADMPDYKAPSPKLEPLPPPVELGGNWYLRGHIGMSNQRVSDLHHPLFEVTPELTVHDKNFESGNLFGGGIGYRANEWLRFDVTGEYRAETGFHGLDTWFDSGAGVTRFNDYTAKKSEWLLLANAYVDLGTWKGLTPYVGGGVGAARNTIHSFRDRGIDGFGSPTLGFADSASKWNFAWALHGGLGFEVTDQLSLDLGYSYVDLGDAETGTIRSYDGAATIQPMEFKRLTSHDVKLGLRWEFGQKHRDYLDEEPYYDDQEPFFKK